MYLVKVVYVNVSTRWCLANYTVVDKQGKTVLYNEYRDVKYDPENPDHMLVKGESPKIPNKNEAKKFRFIFTPIVKEVPVSPYKEYVEYNDETTDFDIITPGAWFLFGFSFLTILLIVLSIFVEVLYSN